MQVNSVDNKTQFNGYVDKSVVKYVEKAVKAHCYDIAHSDALLKRPVNKEEIKEAQKMGEDILNELNKFMEKLETKTGLFVKKRIDSEHYDAWTGYSTMLKLELQNPVAQTPVVIATSTGKNVGGAKPLYYGLFRNFDLEFSQKALDAMKKLTDWVTGNRHGYYDEKVLETATNELAGEYAKRDDMGHFGRKRLLKKAKLVETYLTSIGKSDAPDYEFSHSRDVIRGVRKYVYGLKERKNQERVNRKVVSEMLNNK